MHLYGSTVIDNSMDGTSPKDFMMTSQVKPQKNELESHHELEVLFHFSTFWRMIIELDELESVVWKFHEVGWSLNFADHPEVLFHFSTFLSVLTRSFPGKNMLKSPLICSALNHGKKQIKSIGGLII